MTSKNLNMICSYGKLGKRKNRILLFIFVFSILLFCHIFGLFIHPFEIDYFKNFSYPLNIDLIEIIQDIKSGHNLNQLPRPINQYNNRFLILNSDKCNVEHSAKHSANSFNSFNSVNSVNFDSVDSVNSVNSVEHVRLLIVVKSAVANKVKRNAIRKTWGFENRFSDVNIKRVFVLGGCDDTVDLTYCQDKIDDESHEFGDMIQADFVDNYYNNTVKVVLAMKWVVEQCASAEYILFVDDDYYVSVKNLLRHTGRLSGDMTRLMYNDSVRSDSLDYDLNNRFDGRLYSGYVFNHSTPMRHLGSKWFVSLEEYQFSHYPPYVTAGAFVLTNYSLIDMYYASLYTKHFKFDDIYLGILARKVNIRPVHNHQFYYWKPNYHPDFYAHVIASHGFHDTTTMIKVWNQQKSLGNA